MLYNLKDYVYCVHNLKNLFIFKLYAIEKTYEMLGNNP